MHLQARSERLNCGNSSSDRYNAVEMFLKVLIRLKKCLFSFLPEVINEIFGPSSSICIRLLVRPKLNGDMVEESRCCRSSSSRLPDYCILWAIRIGAPGGTIRCEQNRLGRAATSNADKESCRALGQRPVEGNLLVKSALPGVS